MKRIALAMLFAAALAGCATPSGYWQHSSGDNAQFQRDASQCVYESTMGAPGSTGGAGLSASISQDISAGMRRAELQQLCMQAKGYQFIQR